MLRSFPNIARRLRGWRWVSAHATTDPKEGIEPFSAIPGPRPLPILGNLMELRRNGSSLRLYYEKCLKQYGRIFKLRYPGGNNIVYIANPSTIEDVLRSEGKYPSRSREFDAKIAWFFTHLGYRIPLSFLNDEQWKELRTAIGKQTLPRNVNSYIPGMNDVLQRFTRYLRANRDEKGYIDDISDLLNKLLMELSASFVYNKDLRVVDSGDQDALTFIQAVKTLLSSLPRISYEPPIYKIISTKLYRDVTSAIKTMYDFGNKYAEELQSKSPKAEDAMGLLEQWLTAGKVSKEHAVVLSIDMFAAGVDTSSNTATFMLYEVAANPEVQKQLNAEISSVLGDSRLPTAEDLAAMPYIKGIVKETLRLYSTAPAIARVLTEDTVLMGYHIPAKTNIMYTMYAVGRDEQFFKNPERFDPDRWSNDDINAFAQLPFGFGSRACYGRRFAELELKLILIEMTRHFMLKTDQLSLPVTEGALVRPHGKIPLKLVNRK